MYVVCVYAKVLYDDDVDVYAPNHEKASWAVNDAQVEENVVMVDARHVLLVDDAREWTVPAVEHKRAQVKQPLELVLVLIEEHFPELQGFLEQRELRQNVEFPVPSEPVQETASGFASPAFLAIANPVLQPHSHQSYDL
jgi:hypothetical protein